MCFVKLEYLGKNINGLSNVVERSIRRLRVLKKNRA